MAKLGVLALTFAALIACTSVSAFRTTFFTTTIEDDDNLVFTRSSREQQSCRKEIQPEQLNDCQKYLEQNSPYAGEVLEMTVEDPRKQHEKKQLEQCCRELRNVKEECQCEAVQEAFRQAEKQQQQGGSRHGSQQERQQRQILQKAQNLPSECRLKVQQCRIRSPWI
ncbi:unnamed protein product [Lactuca virosa]|uniref:Bifunctional inhibitor/plant lipid transfer protein/seed storage helical domain-containing protein n=1 Tax=Lactuca virosa TaxID=75947 RepID=A0AAU9MT69_9ASTR|nr:unnamed protein product [Lactuca virosa]